MDFLPLVLESVQRYFSAIISAGHIQESLMQLQLSAAMGYQQLLLFLSTLFTQTQVALADIFTSALYRLSLLLDIKQKIDLLFRR